MIKINLLAEKKAAKAKLAVPGLKTEPTTGTSNVLLSGILLLGVLVAGGWWWVESKQLKKWTGEVARAEQELQRLQEVRKKGEMYKKQKELLERKIQLITDLKKKQTVPVHILDQISKNLPDFLWLDSMQATQNTINIAGKATTYNAVSNFYDNLSASGYFVAVTLGKTSEAPEGVSFSLTCRFQQPEAPEVKPQPQG